MERSLSNTNTADTAATTSDVVIVGHPDAWRLLAKASSKFQGWMKSTKAMDVRGGIVLQVTTEHRHPDGHVTACAESVCFVPGVSMETLVQQFVDALARQ